MKKKLFLSFLLTLLCACCVIFGACSLFGGNGGNDDNGAGGSGQTNDQSYDDEKWSKAELISIGSAVPDGDEIFLKIGNTNKYSLKSRVEVSEGATWKLYSDASCRDELKDGYIENKGGSLSNGNNYFYIRVFSGNMRKIKTYTVIAYKSFHVSVNYYDGEERINSDVIYSGEEFTPTYTPELTGYIFEGWYDDEHNAFSTGVVWNSLNLYAAKKPRTYKATLDANGGEAPQETELFID